MADLQIGVPGIRRHLFWEGNILKKLKLWQKLSEFILFHHIGMRFIVRHAKRPTCSPQSEARTFFEQEKLSFRDAAPLGALV